MTRYLVAIHHPDNYDPAVAEDDVMHRDWVVRHSMTRIALHLDASCRKATSSAHDVGSESAVCDSRVCPC